MKRQTALGHLVEIADVATDSLSLRETSIGWPVEELWVAGDVLDDGVTVEDSAVVMVVDVPPAKLTWLTLNPAAEWAAERLRLRQRPFQWAYRPVGWPAWNHQYRRMVRFWTASAGRDDAAVEALRGPSRDLLEVVEPSSDELAEQLRTELPLSRRHLGVTLDQYFDYGWRRRHKGNDEGPEDHLWRAAAAVSQILDALDELGA